MACCRRRDILFLFAETLTNISIYYSKVDSVFRSAIGVVAAFFIPYLFVVSVGIGGLVMGLKYRQIANNNKTSKVSYDFFLEMANKTIANLIFVILIGLAMVFYINKLIFNPDSFKDITILMYLISMILTYFMFAIRPWHITPNAISNLLALNDRGRSKKHCYIKEDKN